jgi:hypothetical protein
LKLLGSYCSTASQELSLSYSSDWNASTHFKAALHYQSTTE